MSVDPYAIEIRYTLDLLACKAANQHPSSVRIASDSLSLVEAVVRRLDCSRLELQVNSATLQDAIAGSLGLAVALADPCKPADVALFPFSLEEGARPRGEKLIVAAYRNGLSYKSLVSPRTMRLSTFARMSELRRNYQIHDAAGLYSPQFVARWALAKAAEGLNSALYFQLEDRAMRYLVDFRPTWRLSYIVAFVGKQRGAR